MPWNDFLDIMVPVAVAIVATIPGFLAYWSSRRKAPADAAEVITEAAVHIVEKFEKQVAGLEAKVDALNVELDATKSEMRRSNVEMLQAQGQIRLMEKEIIILRGENVRLTDFAAACKVTIENLTTLLRENGFGGDAGGDVPPT
jgi:chromosome segregation ATPase